MSENTALFWEYFLMIFFAILAALEIRFFVRSFSDDENIPVALLIFMILLLLASTFIVGVSLSAIFHIPPDYRVGIIIILCFGSLIIPFNKAFNRRLSIIKNNSVFLDKLRKLRKNPSISNEQKRQIDDLINRNPYN